MYLIRKDELIETISLLGSFLFLFSESRILVLTNCYTIQWFQRENFKLTLTIVYFAFFFIMAFVQNQTTKKKNSKKKEKSGMGRETKNEEREC